MSELLIGWLGSGGTAVEPELSQSRGVTCLRCPRNQKGSFMQRLKRPVADAIKATLSLKNDMKLSTTVDSALGLCNVCDCVCSLKVHVPLATIIELTDVETMKKFPDNCWITKESQP